ncbi:hypothetical protein J8273_2650 [Carpediemonas membranifera]|uniref:Calponin-homology (CH) domain-containing protein n=1 Tax=Carpediemonas membranifera TaxID=201153 RepID=A0A8J6AW91_9EUKA|nr:hypothetical protein J8273_2650 [Carpediemonas membranifera]|eukprot:KAG9395743.1 hypothetical protein J8273_2650 [Carpediemonas membranifera]
MPPKNRNRNRKKQAQRKRANSNAVPADKPEKPEIDDNQIEDTSVDETTNASGSDNEDVEEVESPKEESVDKIPEEPTATDEEPAKTPEDPKVDMETIPEKPKHLLHNGGQMTMERGQFAAINHYYDSCVAFQWLLGALSHLSSPYHLYSEQILTHQLVNGVVLAEISKLVLDSVDINKSATNKFHHRNNVESFIKACKKAGLADSAIVEPNDVVELQNPVLTVNCILKFAEACGVDIALMSKADAASKFELPEEMASYALDVDRSNRVDISAEMLAEEEKREQERVEKLKKAAEEEAARKAAEEEAARKAAEEEDARKAAEEEAARKAAEEEDARKAAEEEAARKAAEEEAARKAAEEEAARKAAEEEAARKAAEEEAARKAAEEEAARKAAEEEAARQAAEEEDARKAAEEEAARKAAEEEDARKAAEEEAARKAAEEEAARQAAEEEDARKAAEEEEREEEKYEEDDDRAPSEAPPSPAVKSPSVVRNADRLTGVDTRLDNPDVAAKFSQMVREAEDADLAFLDDQCPFIVIPGDNSAEGLARLPIMVIDSELFLHLMKKGGKDDTKRLFQKFILLLNQMALDQGLGEDITDDAQPAFGYKTAVVFRKPKGLIPDRKLISFLNSAQKDMPRTYRKGCLEVAVVSSSATHRIILNAMRVARIVNAKFAQKWRFTKLDLKASLAAVLANYYETDDSKFAAIQ